MLPSFTHTYKWTCKANIFVAWNVPLAVEANYYLLRHNDLNISEAFVHAYYKGEHFRFDDVHCTFLLLYSYEWIDDENRKYTERQKKLITC